MYRHVARCHLDLAQLWRCPVAWCTVWKGAPQDLMDHVRYAHRVPEELQSITLETLIPPWTVTRKVYMESLTSCHSGISNDILLFSDIGLSLAHHYRVHKKGVPHVAFRKNYMSQLRALLPLPAAPLAERGSPEPGCSSMEDSAEAVGTSPDHPDARSLAGAYPRSGRHPDESHLTLQSVIPWPRRELWCSIAAPKFCRGRWMSVVQNCRKYVP